MKYIISYAWNYEPEKDIFIAQVSYTAIFKENRIWWQIDGTRKNASVFFSIKFARKVRAMCYKQHKDIVNVKIHQKI